MDGMPTFNYDDLTSGIDSRIKRGYLARFTALPLCSATGDD